MNEKQQKAFNVLYEEKKIQINEDIHCFEIAHPNNRDRLNYSTNRYDNLTEYEKNADINKLLEEKISLYIVREYDIIYNKKDENADELSCFISTLNKSLKKTYGYRQGLKLLRDFAINKIETTFRINYRSSEFTTPIETKTEIKDETGFFDDLAGKKRYVAYSTSIGGEKYNSITGYSMYGTIKNRSSELIVVSVSSTGKDQRNLLMKLFTNIRFAEVKEKYTIEPYQSVEYYLSGNCSNNVTAKIHFNVIEVNGVDLY